MKGWSPSMEDEGGLSRALFQHPKVKLTIYDGGKYYRGTTRIMDEVCVVEKSS